MRKANLKLSVRYTQILLKYDGLVETLKGIKRLDCRDGAAGVSEDGADDCSAGADGASQTVPVSDDIFTAAEI